MSTSSLVISTVTGSSSSEFKPFLSLWGKSNFLLDEPIIIIFNEVNKLEWCEFRLWYGEKVDIAKLYNLRKLLLPILDEHKIEDFLVLNEPKFVLFRVEIEEETKKDIEKSLKELVEQSEGTFSRITIEKWIPEQDARDRILGAAQRLGLRLEEGKGWMIAGREPLNRNWVPTEDNLDLKIKEFAVFMTKVVGKFTRAYVKEMPRIIKDRWLLSVLLHLILNSISVDKIQERESREFPYV